MATNNFIVDPSTADIPTMTKIAESPEYKSFVLEFLERQASISSSGDYSKNNATHKKMPVSEVYGAFMGIEIILKGSMYLLNKEVFAQIVDLLEKYNPTDTTISLILDQQLIKKHIDSNAICIGSLKSLDSMSKADVSKKYNQLSNAMDAIIKKQLQSMKYIEFGNQDSLMCYTAYKFETNSETKYVQMQSPLACNRKSFKDSRALLRVPAIAYNQTTQDSLIITLMVYFDNVFLKLESDTVLDSAIVKFSFDRYLLNSNEPVKYNMTDYFMTTNEAIQINLPQKDID